MKTSRVLCISDLHLAPERPAVTQAFLGFLRSAAREAAALFILGDLFDVWLGDDHPGELGELVGKSLAALQETGTALHIMRGNRDFLLGEDFASRCGAALIADPYILDCHGGPCLLSHGDLLCTRDRDYMAFRKMVRNPAWQKDFLALPLAERRAFAARARAQSKTMTSSKPADIMDVTPAQVDRLLRQVNLTTLIHGHTHRPAVHDFTLGDQPARRIVLGDWHDKGWHVEISAAGHRLLSFPIPA